MAKVQKTTAVPQVAEKKATVVPVAAAKKTIKPAAKTPTPQQLAAAAPAPAVKAKKVNKMGNKDVYGFGELSATSYLMRGLESGKYTRKELEAAFVKEFTEGKGHNRVDPGGEKRKKVTFSVFLSDVTKPFGTYHSSRSLQIDTDATGKMSLNPKRTKAITEAIKGGLLEKMRGVTWDRQPQKLAALLAEYGLPGKEGVKAAKK